MSIPTESFDQFAGSYDEALSQGISVSGENKDFFARGRALWLRRHLDRLGVVPASVLDFGCGTGSATPHLLGCVGCKELLGVDLSRASIKLAVERYGSERARFMVHSGEPLRDRFALAFCNGVFHHIPPAQRSQAIEFVRQSLDANGLFALWENNPWNPGTRLVMSRIPFDRDAIPLSSLEACRLLRSGGFEILSVTYCFVFPRVLRLFRCLEPMLASIPAGAQYQVLARRMA